MVSEKQNGILGVFLSCPMQHNKRLEGDQEVGNDRFFGLPCCFANTAIEDGKLCSCFLCFWFGLKE